MRKVPESGNEIFIYAVKLLAARDYSVAGLREKLAARYDDVPDTVIQQLIAKRFLNDRRYTENYVARRKERGVIQVREELAAHGIAAELAEEILKSIDWPSLHEALTAKMVDWHLRPPLQTRHAARLFRALARLGYEEDAIREELEQLHEQ
jgi:SOS response regulatory protein OraA/RecX